MKGKIYEVCHYRAANPQSMRGVVIHSPSLIQVLSGEKQLLGDRTTLSNKHLLLCRAHSKWQFINQPSRQKFLSRQFIFHLAPSDELIKLSQSCGKEKQQAVIKITPELEQSVAMLAEFDILSISCTTAYYLLMSVYQQLAELGLLHQLFILKASSIKMRLIDYFSQDPSLPYDVEQVARHFGMSRATLLRKLKYEEASFSQLLLEVRLHHALALMQLKPLPIVELAVSCGYQSVARFNQRFEQQFGLSPRAYMQTVFG